MSIRDDYFKQKSRPFVICRPWQSVESAMKQARAVIPAHKLNSAYIVVVDYEAYTAVSFTLLADMPDLNLPIGEVSRLSESVVALANDLDVTEIDTHTRVNPDQAMIVIDDEDRVRGVFISPRAGGVDGTSVMASVRKLIDRLAAKEVYTRTFLPYEIKEGEQLPLFVVLHTDAERFKAEDAVKAQGGSGGTHEDVIHGPTTRIPRDTALEVVIEAPDLLITPETEPIQHWNERYLIFKYKAQLKPGTQTRDIKVKIFIMVGPLAIARIEATIDRLLEDTVNPLRQAQLNSLGGEKIFRKIFISYSRKDKDVVRLFRHYTRLLGDDIFMDTYDLRPENWQKGLGDAIQEADIFMLFWSPNSSASQNVKDEWMYARDEHPKYKTVAGDGFIRPIYWQEPPVPPPAELRHLNFKFYKLDDSSL